MEVKSLQLKKVLRTGLLVLLLNAVGIGKMYAYDFSAVCSTGQTLYYTITNASNHYVALVAPGGNNSSGWNGYTKPTGDIVLPESVQYGGVTYTVTSIGNYAFRGCSGLTGNLNIPNSVTTIGDSAFLGCDGFTGSLTIPNSVTVINRYAFEGCHGLTGSLTIPNTVCMIGEEAFESCSSFTGSLTISNSLTYIRYGTFSGCSGFTGSLIIPNSVAYINGYAFRNCRGFSSITSLAETPPSVYSNTFESCNPNATVYVTCGSEGEYASLSWGGFNSFVGLCGGIISVAADSEEYGVVTGGGSFEAGQTCTVTATANDGYTFVNWTHNGVIVSDDTEYTFYVGGNMELVAHFVPISDGNIVFADANVKSICVFHWDTNGDGELSYAEAASVTSFSGCFRNHQEIISFDELQYFIRLSSIGSCAFQNCTGLASIVFPNSLVSIGGAAFYGCRGLSGSLILPSSVMSIGSSAFYGCFNLTGALVLPSSVMSIGSSAFYGCTRLTGDLIIPNSVISIGDSAFYGCFGLTGALVLPSSVTSIGSSAFSGCSGFTGDLVIPSSVTSIGSSAFSGCSALTNIVYNATNCADVTNSDRPFAGCSGTLTIGANVQRIPSYLFYNCSGFSGDLTLPNTVTSIGYYAFFGCSGFTGGLVIPNSLTIIVAGAFGNCSGLSGTLTIPNSITSIEYSAFSGCSGLTGDLIIPNSVISIGGSAFYGCCGFSGDLIIPNSVTTIGVQAFRECSGFTGGLTISNALTTISNYVFCNCSGFTGGLTIPNSVTTIGQGAFCNCSGFTGELVIPNTVTVIEEASYDGAFQNCSGFESLVLGNSLTAIGKKAFSGCSGFNSITSLAETPPTLGNNVFVNNTNTPIYVPCGFEEAYSSISWGGFNEIYGLCEGMVTVVAEPEEGGTVSGGGTFEGGSLCTVTAAANDGYTFENWQKNGSIVSANAEYTFIVAGDMTIVAHFVSDDNIHFADANVKSICINHWDTNGDGELSYEEAALATSLGSYFQSNSQITSFDELQYFTGLSSIDDYAFQYCTGLTSIVLPDYLTSIGNYSFYYCTGLTGSLIIPNSVTSIGNHAFYNCGGFTGDLVISNSVTSIGGYAFYNCSSFTGDLIIPNSVTSIGNYAFNGCSGFTGDLIISNSVTSIGIYAFNGCSGFTGDLIIPNSVTSIGIYAFNDCSGFTGDLVIPNSVTSIGNCVFSGCSGFTGSLIIPNSVISIGTYAFRNCSGFSEVHYNATNCADVYNNTQPFYGCGGSLIIGDNVRRIPAYMFKDSFTGSLTIGNSVTVIGQNAFYRYYGGFTGVYYTGSIDQWCNISFSGWLSNPLFCAHDLYINNELVTDLVIPENVTQINSYAFYGATCLTSMTLGNSVTSIGYEAFFGCSSLTGVYFSGSISQWCGIAFNGYNSNPLFYAHNLYVNNELVTDLVIPESVTQIKSYAFYGATCLTSLTIGNSVTTIGSSAFYGCSGLTSLTIPNSVTSIDNYAFSGCSWLLYIKCMAETPPMLGVNVFSISANTPVYVPCGFDEAYSFISWGEFSNFLGLCDGTITVVANPEEGGVVEGGGSYLGGSLCTVTATPNEGYALAYWSRNGTLTSTEAEYTFYVAGDMELVAHFVQEGNIVFADANVKSICVSHWDTNGDGELSYVEAASVTNLGNYFKGKTQITSFEELQYFTGLSAIGDYAFSGCYNLTGNLVIPNSVTVIGEGAFYNCSGFTGELVIPNSVTSFFEDIESYEYMMIDDIPPGAFENCSGFTGLVLSNSLTNIPFNTFKGCSGFTGTLTIPNSVQSIGMGAFYGCSGFTGELIIPNSVATIFDGFDLFDEYYLMWEVPGAFENCSGFTNLVISDSWTGIACNTFKGCSGFTGSLSLPSSIQSIGMGAFSGCSGFTGSLSIPNSVIRIAQGSFHNCSGFTGELNISFEIIDNEEDLMEGLPGAFQGCSGFTSLVFNNSPIRIANNAFHGCYGFTGSLDIPNSVRTIGSGAFYGCRGFTGELNIPNSVTSIGGMVFDTDEGAFANCKGFTSLVLSNSLISIGASSFSGCSGFTGSLIIPNSVTLIGDDAFSGWYEDLTETIVLRTTPPTLGWYVFGDNELEYPIYVPYESLNDYKTANHWSDYEDRIFPMTYKTISGYGEGEGNYSFIASPLVENTAPTVVNNMITSTDYDLYQFNQSATDGEWQNYKANSFNLINGQGYLYANTEEVNLIFKGEFNEEDTQTVDLAYDAIAPYAGWNLVGNPFPVSAYANRSYYVMNEAGTAIEPVAVSSTMPIPACTGVMVKAETTGESVTFSKTAPEMQSQNNGALQITVSEAGTSALRQAQGPQALDKAIVSFNAGDRLEKFVFNKDNAQLYIPSGKNNYAILCAEKTGELPLNFKAIKNGEYTLTVDSEKAEMDYLHLIDNITGNDVDLLAEPGYSFEAKTTDYASRFKLVFSANAEDGPSTGSGTFAFLNSSGNLTIYGIEGEATLQVVDVLGHVLSSEQFSGSYEKKLDVTPGVYMLRLINGDDMKVQKIVVK